MQGDTSRLNLLIYAIIILLLVFRISRPQRISVGRMWFTVAFLMLFAAFGVYESAVLFHSSPLQIAVAVVIGLAAGIPLGLLRGHHTQVQATDRHGVMQLGASWATALIFIGAFILRAVIRAFIPPGNAVGMVVSDGLILFAIGFVGATYYAVYRKYEALDHAETVGT